MEKNLLKGNKRRESHVEDKALGSGQWNDKRENETLAE